MSTKQNPPSWCSDAVATSKGWCHPKTGEILISKAGLVVEVEEKQDVEKVQAEKKSGVTKKSESTKQKKVEQPAPVEIPVATVEASEAK